jgi:phosphohistidine swiveling domain-containing protein
VPTKGSRLQELRQNGFAEFILPIVIVKRNEITRDFVQLQVSGFEANFLAVRSSASDEDQEHSNAGRYLTLLNVPIADAYDAVIRVLKSYSTYSETDEVLIQPFLQQTTRSGVVFTHDPDTSSEYMLINYSNDPNITTVTSGSGNGRLEVIHSSFDFTSSSSVIQRNRHLIEVVKNVLDFSGGTPLDIEFAEVEEKIVILQVRSLKTYKTVPSTDLNQKYLSDLCDKIEDWKLPNSNVPGDTTVFGIMPDWNPAEIVGIRPRPLALSLFRELITDFSWAQGRNLLGYKNVTSESILFEISGQPYINVRNSFYSLIPREISSELSRKLINHYIEKLSNNPHLHDKVESEIVLSSYTFDVQDKLNALPGEIDSSEKEQLKRALIKLTRELILGEAYGLNDLIEDFRPLDFQLETILQVESSATERIQKLVSICKNRGAIPFASAARLAFIGTDLINSLVGVSIITKSDAEEFFNSIQTVTTRFLHDWSALDKEEFLDRYGHLRPGTYDIRIPTYGREFSRYFDQPRKKIVDSNSDAAIRRKIIEAISETKVLSELNVSAQDIIDFVEKSIDAREVIKFHYTKLISKILDIIAEYASENEISTDDASYFDISTFLNFDQQSQGIMTQLLSDVKTGKEKYKITEAIWLPPLIQRGADVFAFEIPETIPNFITRKQVIGQCCEIGEGQEVNGKILLIENADPGFDWIFTKNIIGFVTCYGGSNSHMAVRARELNIPAVLGVGREMYNRLRSSENVYIDCTNKRIEY